MANDRNPRAAATRLTERTMRFLLSSKLPAATLDQLDAMPDAKLSETFEIRGADLADLRAAAAEVRRRVEGPRAGQLDPVD